MLILCLVIDLGCRYAVSWCDLELTFDFAKVILKMLSEIYLRNREGRYHLLVGLLVGGWKRAKSWCVLGVTSDLISAKMFLNVTKIYRLLQLYFS